MTPCYVLLCVSGVKDRDNINYNRTKCVSFVACIDSSSSTVFPVVQPGGLTYYINVPNTTSPLLGNRNTFSKYNTSNHFHKSNIFIEIEHIKRFQIEIETFNAC